MAHSRRNHICSSFITKESGGDKTSERNIIKKFFLRSVSISDAIRTSGTNNEFKDVAEPVASLLCRKKNARKVYLISLPSLASFLFLWNYRGTVRRPVKGDGADLQIIQKVHQKRITQISWQVISPTLGVVFWSFRPKDKACWFWECHCSTDC